MLHSGNSLSVIGLGATGMALAAHLSLRGWRVTLWGRNRDRVEGIRAQGGLRITGDLGECLVPISMITSDLGHALQERVILISIVQNGHRALAEAMVPLMRDNHVVLMLNGGGGSLEMSQVWRTRRPDHPWCLGETSAPAHSARIVGEGRVFIRLTSKERRLRISAFPAQQTGRLIEHLEGIINVRPVRHVIEVGLCNVNAILHPLPTLLNYAAYEGRGGEIALSECMTPGTLRALDAHDRERMRLLKAVGGDPVPMDVLFQELGLDPADYRRSGPPLPVFNRVEERFLAEDVPYGIGLMVTVGRLIGFPTPVSDAILQIASCVRGAYGALGRTCESLGIDDLNKEQLVSYLMHGPASRSKATTVGHA